MTNEELANELSHRLSLRTGNLPGLRLYLPQENVEAIISALLENSRLREALGELLKIHDWMVLVGGTEGPLPQEAITKAAEMQVPAINNARAALRQLDTPNMSNTP